MRLRGLRFDQWRDRFGWIVGALVISASIAALIMEFHSTQPPRFSCLGAAGAGLVLGCGLLVPASPRIAKALVRLATAPAPGGPSGPLPVATVDIALPPLEESAASILVRIWHPAAEDDSASASAASAKDAAPVACAHVLCGWRLAKAQAAYPILLYAPGGGGHRHDNASTSAFLASHGYVVAAIDDVDLDPRPPNADESMQPLQFDLSSAAAFETTLRRGADKARRQAGKALAALDRLETCADADWRGQVRFDRVGFFGFSFGGATAAEAGAMDPRVAAVANFDGWLFGRAALGGLDNPYMIVLSDIALPGPRQRRSRDPKVYFEAKLTDRDLCEETRLANRLDGYGFLVRGSFHESLSDEVFSRRSYRTWFVTDPVRVKAIKDAYLLAFFDAHVRGLSRPLLRQTPSPYREVEVMHANQKWLDRMAVDTKQTLAAK